MIPPENVLFYYYITLFALAEWFFLKKEICLLGSVKDSDSEAIEMHNIHDFMHKCIFLSALA